MHILFSLHLRAKSGMALQYRAHFAHSSELALRMARSGQTRKQSLHAVPRSLSIR